MIIVSSDIKEETVTWNDMCVEITPYLELGVRAKMVRGDTGDIHYELILGGQVVVVYPPQLLAVIGVLKTIAEISDEPEWWEHHETRSHKIRI